MAELISMRKAYGEALVKLGEHYPNVVVLSADVSNSDHSFMFAEVFGDRFINIGIAEQALVDVAVGFAYCDKIPFANTFSFLFATRALEMIRTHLCYGKANVKLVGAYAGLSDSYDGPTHHSVCDIAVMRSLPNMTVVVPSDPMSLNSLLPQVAEWDGPVYLRLNRNEVPVLFDDSYQPEIGKGVTHRDGNDLTIVCTGLMVSRALRACEELDAKGINSRLIEVHTIKPFDYEIIIEAVEVTGAIVTVEEHSVIGGLGGAVSEAIAGIHPVPVIRVGVNDTFAETGPYNKLLDRYGMAVVDIVNASIKAMEAKNSAKR